MTKKHASPDHTREIVVLRAAGWSLAAIAERVGVSVSTVQRALKAHPTPKGAAMGEAIQAAKKELAEQFRGDERIQALYQEIVSDTIAHVRLSREKGAEALEHLNPSDTETAALTMRALAGHATVVKAHADMLRLLIPRPDDTSELPQLIIRAMSREDVERLRREQAEEADELLGVGDDTDGDEG